MSLGASPRDWMHWDLILGFGADLLPVVPDPNATPSFNSKVKKFGKIPSCYDREGGAHGIKDWPTREITPEDITRWSSDDRLSVCLRTGRSYIYAIDIDIEDPTLADAIDNTIHASTDTSGWRFPERWRNNSNKSLLIFRLSETCTLTKRIIDCGDAGRVEFLGVGQQCLLSGSHSSGSRYEWRNGLPDSIPTLEVAEFERIWTALQQFAKVPAVTGTADAPRSIEASAGNTLLTEIEPQQLEDLCSALEFKPLLAAAADNSVWSEVGYALLSLGDAGFGLFEEFSEDAPNYVQGNEATWWDTHIDQTPRSDFRHIFTLARQLGWRTVADVDAFPTIDTAPGELIPVAPERPILRLKAGELDKYAVEAESILNPDIFVQASGLVRIGAGSEVQDTTLNRTAEQRSVIRVTAEYLRRKLNSLAFIQKYSKIEKAWVPIDCPAALAINIIDQRDWPKLRVLEAISRAPFLRNDGSVCETEGFDTSSGVMYIPNDTFPPMPATLSKEIAMRALDALLEPFAEFPYATEAARTAFMAHVLTEVARVALDSAPMFWYSAPSAGTGKTLLSKMPAIITHGTETTLRPWVDDNDEIRKVIFASLLAGDRSVGFDNVPNGSKIRSPLLCALLTSGSTYKDRKLGASEVLVVKNKATCFASGNNITPVSDMARRSLIIRLDADVTAKQLRERSFSISNLEGYVKANRPAIFVNALTIIRSYLAEPSRIGLAPLPSFEKWSEFVREPLIWLGMTDPVDTQEQETDDEMAATAVAFEYLAEKTVVGFDKEFSAKEIVESVVAIVDSDGTAYATLVAAGCSEPTNALKIGYWLRDKRDVIAGGYKLQRQRLLHGTQKWVLKNLNTHNSDLL